MGREACLQLPPTYLLWCQPVLRHGENSADSVMKTSNGTRQTFDNNPVTCLLTLMEKQRSPACRRILKHTTCLILALFVFCHKQCFHSLQHILSGFVFFLPETKHAFVRATTELLQPSYIT